MQNTENWSLRVPTKHIKEQTLYLPVRLMNAVPHSSLCPTIAIPLELLSDPGVARLVNDEYFGNGFEYFERNYLLHRLKSGDFLIDIGAHFGLYSIFASASVQDLHCLALEPHPANFEVMKRSIRHSGLQYRIKGLQCALGGRDGIGKLRINSSMGHHLIRDDSSEFNVVDTPLRSLDNLIKRFKFGQSAMRIWLKVDTEGREKSVLAGASELLGSGKVQGVLWESSVGSLENPANKEIELFLRDFGFFTKKISAHSMFSTLAEKDP
jgi:FkbM family methyltransferase